MASRKMNNTIYVAGKVYDLATTTAEEIKTDVQNRLDAHYEKDCIIFRINVWNKEKEVTINCTDPKSLDRLINRFIGKEFGIVPDSFRLTLV